MQPTAQTQNDWKEAIEFCQVVDNAYHIPPGPTFTVGGTKYKIVANIYANDLATDANQGITDEVTIGLICQTDPGRDVVIPIRGTEGILEWAHDLNFDKVPCPFLPGAGQTDDGFTQMYNSLTTDPGPDSQSVVKALPTLGFNEPVSSVTICGHSLGGALATLLALDLAATAANPANAAYAQFRNPTVFTYASPRTGDSMFAATYNQVVTNSNRIENRFDLVPHLPATWMGYQHVLAPWELTPDQHVKYDLYCEHSITTYLYLMSRQAGGAVIPLENKCQAAPPAQAQA